jgi:hypothetical protein
MLFRLLQRAIMVALAAALCAQAQGELPSVTLAQQSGAPATLSSISTTPGKLIVGGVLLNTGAKTVVACRIGWRASRPRRKPEFGLGDWTELPGGIKPLDRQRRQQPQHAPMPPSAFALTSLPAGAVLLEFFVAAVKFDDGTIWQEKPDKLKPRPRSTRR